MPVSLSDVSSTNINATFSVSAGVPPHFLRRKAAAAYLQNKYGFGASATLAKLAVVGGGPEYHKAGRIVLYAEAGLDTWALSKIGAARHSTSEPECA
jgi:hypothetical protein